MVTIRGRCRFYPQKVDVMETTFLFNQLSDGPYLQFFIPMLRSIDHFGADSMRSIYIIVTHKIPTYAARGLNTQICGVKTEVMWAVHCIHTLSKVSFFDFIMCRFWTIDLDMNDIWVLQDYYFSHAGTKILEVGKKLYKRKFHHVLFGGTSA